MKEIKILESWADGIIAERIEDRPLERSQDIQYQAIRAYPDRSPEQALQLFVGTKMAANDKMNLDQNKLINAQKRENEKLQRSLGELSRELSDHEREAERTDREVARLKDLSSKLGPAGAEQQSTIKASADRVEAMLNDVNKLQGKAGIDEKMFKDIKDKIEKIKSQPVDNKEIEKVQQTLSLLNQQQTVDTELYDKVMIRLSTTEEELAKKEERFQKSIKGNKDKIARMGAQYAPLSKEIADMQEKMKAIQSTSETIFGDLDAKTQEAQRASAEAEKSAKKLNIIMPHIKNILAQAGSAPSAEKNVVRLPVRKTAGPNLADVDKQSELERSMNMAAGNVNEDIRTSDIEYRNWVKNNTPVVLRMFKNRFPNVNETFKDDQIVDQIHDNLIYLYKLEQVTTKIMNDFLDVMYYNLEEEGPDNQMGLFSSSLSENYERMLDKIIGLPEIFKKH